MKILFDARHIFLPYTGLGRYAFHLLQALLRSGLNRDVTVLLYRGLLDKPNFLSIKLLAQIDDLPPGNRARVEYIDSRPFTLGHHLNTGTYINRTGCDLYFFPNFDPPIGIKVPYSMAVHDLYPLVMDDYVRSWRLPKLVYYNAILAYAIRCARQVACLTDWTRDDLVRQKCAGRPDLASKLVVTGAGPCLPAWTGPAPRPAVPYLLYVGDRRPQKNLKKMVDTYVELRTRHGYRGDFRIVGSPRNFDLDLEAYVEGKEGIRLIGNVDDGTLNGMFAGCDALFFLSRYEGFGIPVVEAAQHDRKIITSSTTALGEVAPSGSLKLDPYGDPADLAVAISAYLASGPAEYGDYKQRYTWDRAARTIFGDGDG